MPRRPSNPDSRQGRRSILQLGVKAIDASPNHHLSNISDRQKETIAKLLMFYFRDNSCNAIELKNFAKLIGRSPNKVVTVIRSLLHQGVLLPSGFIGDVPTAQQFQLDPNMYTFSIKKDPALTIYAAVLVKQDWTLIVPFTVALTAIKDSMHEEYISCLEKHAAKEERNAKKAEMTAELMNILPSWSEVDVKALTSQGTKVIHKLTLDLARGENAYDAVRAAVPDRELKKKFTVQNQYGSHGNNVIANTFGSRQAELESAHRAGLRTDNYEDVKAIYNTRDRNGKTLDDYTKDDADRKFEQAKARWGYADTVEDRRRFFCGEPPAPVAALPAPVPALPAPVAALPALLASVPHIAHNVQRRRI